MTPAAPALPLPRSLEHVPCIASALPRLFLASTGEHPQINVQNDDAIVD
jgi:hypothetical protein